MNEQQQKCAHDWGKGWDLELRQIRDEHGHVTGQHCNATHHEHTQRNARFALKNLTA